MSSGDSWRAGLPSLQLELQGVKTNNGIAFILQFSNVIFVCFVLN